MSNEFPIEKGVPKPSHRTKYPWFALEVGDSFFVPGKTAATIGSLLHHTGKRHGRRYSARTVDGGVRVWRDE